MNLINNEESNGKVTLLNRFNDFRNKYKSQVAATIAIIVFILFVVSEFIPEVQEFTNDKNVIQYLILLFVLDIAATITINESSKSIQISENQEETMPKLIASSKKSKSKNADLIEYAATTTLPLIRSLKRDNVNIRILIKHPETVSGMQKNRTIATLETLYNSVFEDYSKFEIRCYKLPYSLRGRRIGNEILELGWLTPDVKRQTAFGHGNPSLLLNLNVQYDTDCINFFEKTFDTLWKHGETVDAKTLIPS